MNVSIMREPTIRRNTVADNLPPSEDRREQVPNHRQEPYGVDHDHGLDASDIRERVQSMSRLGATMPDAELLKVQWRELCLLIQYKACRYVGGTQVEIGKDGAFLVTDHTSAHAFVKPETVLAFINGLM